MERRSARLAAGIEARPEVAGASGRSGRRAAGALESEVLAALWVACRPLTPAEIQAAVGGGLAYNTVHTVLTRLAEKGLVVRVAQAGRRTYEPVKDAAEMAAERMRSALEAGGDRAQILRRFVTSLDAADERALRAVLDEDPPA